MLRRTLGAKRGLLAHPPLDLSTDEPLEAQRYRGLERLASSDAHECWLVEDRWSGKHRVWKAGPPEEMLHEAAVLLALPPGLGPALLDVREVNPAQLALILEAVGGVSFASSLGACDESQVARVFSTVLAAMSRFHRLGVVHGDLKPSHVRLVDSGSTARLLDFGSAWSPGSPSGLSDLVRRATPEFVAPELRHGWGADERADQFSLARTLLTVRPALSSDPAWASILGRMSEALPVRRFPDLESVRRELELRIGGTGTAASRAGAVFPSGPMQGRDVESLRFARRARSHQAVVIHALPGTGLTRFLLESALTWVKAGRRCPLLVDLGGEDGVTVIRSLAPIAVTGQGSGAELFDRSQPLWVACSDPTRSLGWTRDEVRAPLRRFLRTVKGAHFDLVPINAASWGRVVDFSLGSNASSRPDPHGRMLCERSDRRFSVAARGFDLPLDQLEDWTPQVDGPSFGSFSQALARTLAILSRLGFSFERRIAVELTNAFSMGDSFRELRREGALLTTSSTRIAFATPSLFRAARAAQLPDETSVDAWLCASWTPTPRDANAVIEAAARARRIGDFERESVLLRTGLDLACGELLWTEILALTRYLSSTPAASLPDDWSRAKVLLWKGRAEHNLRLPGGLETIRDVAREDGDPASTEALFHLANTARNTHRWDDYETHMTALSRRTTRGDRSAQLFHAQATARTALVKGDRDSARSNATLVLSAAKREPGAVGNAHLVDLCMVLAGLEMTTDPDKAVRIYRSAFRYSSSAQSDVLLLLSIGHTHDRRGEVKLFAQALEEASRRTSDLAGSLTELRLRADHAWAMMLSGREFEAESETAALLARQEVQQDPLRLLPLTALSGVLASQRGLLRSSLSAFSKAWSLMEVGVSAQLRAGIQDCFTDSVVAARAWESVGATGLGADRAITGSPLVDLPQARWNAVVSRASGDIEGAWRQLLSARRIARKLIDRQARARFLCHLADAGIEAAQSTSRDKDRTRRLRVSRVALEQASKAGGHDIPPYTEARILLARAEAERAAGDGAGARRDLARCIEICRPHGYRGILARALSLQLEVEMGAAK